MNQENNNIETDISSTIYDFLGSKAKLKLALIGISVFIISFLLHFPVTKNLEKALHSTLSQIQGCPINYSGLDISFFLPHIELKEVIIGGECFQQPTQNLTFNLVDIRPAFPSIFPLGPRFRLTAKTEKSEINIYTLISFGSQKNNNHTIKNPYNPFE